MIVTTLKRDLRCVWLAGAAWAVVTVAGCGGGQGRSRSETGGRDGSGGAGATNATGGANGTGGGDGTGGATSTGGSNGAGGITTGAGGAVASGGRGVAGGPAATGGSAGARGGMGGTLGPVGATVTVNSSSRFQTMEGFGAALAFYVNFLSEHPNRAEIYNLVFRDLGLDVLRVGNWYQTLTVDEPTVAVVAAATASLGHAPRLLMSSWSPPASLKSNGDTKNGGTLIQQNGAFAYDQFGQWWASALQAYATRGVRPDFISIQNEPDFKATWETCLFGPGEGPDAANGGLNVAGYDKALEAVFARVQSFVPRPALLAPEVTGLASMKAQSYLARLNLAHVGGVAHHLYNGGSGTTPDGFNTALQAVLATAGSQPRFMTEFAPTAPDMFATAWLINNVVTIENANAYFYWDLTWAPPGGLVTTENPFDRASWTTAKGYIVRDTYYALKHFARWVDTGWVRVAASSSVAAVKSSAFVSPDGRQLTVVLLNTGTTSLNVAVGTGSWAFTTSDVFRTAGTTERTRELGPLASGGVVQLPARAIATVTLAQ